MEGACILNKTGEQWVTLEQRYGYKMTSRARGSTRVIFVRPALEAKMISVLCTLAQKSFVQVVQVTLANIDNFTSNPKQLNHTRICPTAGGLFCLLLFHHTRNKQTNIRFTDRRRRLKTSWI